MKQKHCLRKIYKLHSKQLKKAKWKLCLPLDEALLKSPDSVVTLNSSQALRFIDDILGIENIDSQVADVKRQIKDIKKQPKCKKNKDAITALYKQLYSLEFQPHYLCVIMDTNADYDRANKGFSINGIKYRRLLGTNGGIKNSTITSQVLIDSPGILREHQAESIRIVVLNLVAILIRKYRLTIS